jgi:hypothetical protein
MYGGYIYEAFVDPEVLREAVLVIGTELEVIPLRLVNFWA